MGQVQSVTIQPHTSPIGGIMGVGSLWHVGQFYTFMKKTFVSRNKNLNGYRFNFLKRKFGFGFKTQTQFWYDFGECIFLGRNFAKF
jgi:hypothetical protein